MSVSDQQCQLFIDWFQKNGGAIDLTAMGIIDFPASEGGRGAVALKDISVSPHLLLSLSPVLTYACEGRSCTLLDSPESYPVDSYFISSYNLWVGELEEIQAQRGMVRPDFEHDVGGCSRRQVEMGTVYE